MPLTSGLSKALTRKVQTNLFSRSTLLLDEDLPAPAVAVGMRRLRADYTGYAMLIASYSDVTNQAYVKFDDTGKVSQYSALVHANGTWTPPANLLSLSKTDMAYVITWYDQSGNNRNFTNASAYERPMIVYYGMQNDGPRFDASNDYLYCGYTFESGDDDYTYVGVCKTNSASTLQGLFSDGKGNNYNQGIEVLTLSSDWSHFVRGQDLNSSLDVTTNPTIVNASFDNDGSSNNHKLRVNGAEETITTSENLLASTRSQFVMGTRRAPVSGGTFVNGWSGNITEVVGFEVQLTTAQSETMEENMAAHYNITLA
jgi:hypothetical protein